MLTYLSVPYSEKEEAKKLGARWDPKKQLWFSIKGEKELIDRWPLNDLPIIELIGEDRSLGGNSLFVDLVPTSCWFTNVRKCVHTSDWDRLRRFIYERANNKCECCHDKTQLEAHERWHFDGKTKVQKLMRIIALCNSCHETTHMGLAQIKGKGDIAIEHLMKVTGIDKSEAKKQVDKSFSLWRERNSFEWNLDLSIITSSGIKLSKEFNKTERNNFSETETSNIRSIENNNGQDSKNIKNITIKLEETQITQLNQTRSQDETINKKLLTNLVYNIKDASNIDECAKYTFNNLPTKNNNGLINKIRNNQKYIGTIWHYMLLFFLNLFSKIGPRHD